MIIAAAFDRVRVDWCIGFWFVKTDGAWVGLEIGVGRKRGGIHHNLVENEEGRSGLVWVLIKISNKKGAFTESFANFIYEVLVLVL